MEAEHWEWILNWQQDTTYPVHQVVQRFNLTIMRHRPTGIWYELVRDLKGRTKEEFYHHPELTRKKYKALGEALVDILENPEPDLRHTMNYYSFINNLISPQ